MRGLFLLCCVLVLACARLSARQTPGEKLRAKIQGVLSFLIGVSLCFCLASIASGFVRPDEPDKVSLAHFVPLSNLVLAGLFERWWIPGLSRLANTSERPRAL